MTPETSQVQQSNSRDTSAPPPAMPAAGTAFLIHWLADRDEPCRLCVCNLRALSRPVCPECGNELRLSVSLADPYLNGGMTLAVSLLLPAGLGLLGVFMIAARGMPRGRESAASPAIVYQAVAIPLQPGWW